MRTIALSTSSLDALGYIHGQSPQLRELTSPTWVCTQTIAPPAGNDDGTPESRDSLQLEELRCLMSRTTLELVHAIKHSAADATKQLQLVLGLERGEVLDSTTNTRDEYEHKIAEMKAC